METSQGLNTLGSFFMSSFPILAVRIPKVYIEK